MNEYPQGTIQSLNLGLGPMRKKRSPVTPEEPLTMLQAENTGMLADKMREGIAPMQPLLTPEEEEKKKKLMEIKNGRQVPR